MASSLKTGLYFSRSNETNFKCKTKGVLGFCPSVVSLQFKPKDLHVLSIDFRGKPLHVSDQKRSKDWNAKAPTTSPIIDFYSPGCGGCRALHPKIQLQRFLHIR